MTETPEQPIRNLLVDDHAVVRKGMRALLDREPGLEVVGEATVRSHVSSMLRKLQLASRTRRRCTRCAKGWPRWTRAGRQADACRPPSFPVRISSGELPRP